MVTYKFVDVSIDSMDMLVDAEFESALPSFKTQVVLREIANVLDMGMRLPIFFEGLSAIKLEETRIEMSFRFSRKANDLARLSENERDALPRVRTHFVIHVFAKVDNVHKLGSVPFPEDFRQFIKFDL